MARCRSCNAEIVWAVTRHGKHMPVDAEPSADGNVELVDDAGTMRATVHGQATLDAGPLHLSHYVTCPDADSWRGR